MDYQKIADRVDQDNDAKFQHRVDTAVETLSNILGYTLLPSSSSVIRSFNVGEYDLWQRTDPFYELTAIRINDGTLSTPITNYRLGQNGQPNGTWHNGILLCGCSRLCHCRISRCSTYEVDAKWGFAAPTVDGDNTYVTLPLDLQAVLDAMVTETYDDTRNIKHESRGSRSYTKFDKVAAVDEFASIIRKYKRDW